MAPAGRASPAIVFTHQPHLHSSALALRCSEQWLQTHSDSKRPSRHKGAAAPRRRGTGAKIIDWL